jgi:AcrR family transcriptional regulator
MPRNRRAVDAEAKQHDLVAAATELFLADGYDATPIAAVAKQAGVTTNTVYWYFADKEQLLIAVLDALVDETWRKYGRVARRPPAARLAWVVRQLQRVSQLIATVHARIEHSERLNAWHDGFHDAVRQHLRSEIEALGIAPDRVDVEADIVVFTVEGLITHHYDESGVEAICQAIADRWTATAASDETHARR